MNGKDRVALQEKNGVRAIVSEIDRLVITFGAGAVEVLTPKVETRVRSGYIAQRPLSATCTLIDIQVAVTLTIPYGFPNHPIEIIVRSSRMDIEPILQQKVNKFASSSSGEVFPTAEEIVTVTRDNYADLVKCMGEEDEINGRITDKIEEIEDIVDEDDDSDAEPSMLKELIVESKLKPTISSEDSMTYSHYTCRKCRTFVFSVDELGRHTLDNKGSNRCNSFFLTDPPSWLTIGAEESGKINCSKCQTRLGSWSWIGCKCSCGKWIVPAFQLTKSKLDWKL